MQKVKAVLKFIDAAGRMVCLTETNETALVYLRHGQEAPIAGATVELERVEGQRRVTDWSLA